jgi:hypothetical protein
LIKWVRKTLKRLQRKGGSIHKERVPPKKKIPFYFFTFLFLHLLGSSETSIVDNSDDTYKPMLCQESIQSKWPYDATKINKSIFVKRIKFR